MLKNYFIVAVRTFKRNKLHSIIKVSGLALGISACLVIYLIISFELSFDTFQPGRDRIYRVYSQFSGLFEGVNRGVPSALPAALSHEFTGFEAVASFQTYNTKVQIRDKEIKTFEAQDKIIFADPEYFKVFPVYDWIAGSPQTLTRPFVVVLTESKARLYFGTSDAGQVLDREIVYTDSLSVTVGGIVRDVKQRTDLDFTEFISSPSIQQSWLKGNYNPDDWGSTNSSSQCFVRLSEGTGQKHIEDQMPLLAKHYSEHSKDVSWKSEFKLQPLRDLHFNSKLGIFDPSRSPAHMTTLEILGVVAVLLLVIAAINFINLETAQAIRRAREVGVRKVMGSSRSSLVMHFLMDSFLLTLAAVLLAIPVSYGALTYYAEFIPKGVSFNLMDPVNLSFLVGTLAAVSLLAGIYPAFVLSSFQPARALKGEANDPRQSSAAFLRKGLTVFQFASSQVLIVGTIMIAWQIRYMMNKDLGFSKDAIITVSTPWWEPAGKRDALRNELDRLSGIQAICLQSNPPTTDGYSTSAVKFKSALGEVVTNVHQKYGDTAYLSLYDIKLLAGRNLHAGDSTMEMLVNDAYRKVLGFATPAEVLGAVVEKSKVKYTIVGVMADFHSQSLHHAIEPLCYFYRSKANGLGLKLAARGKEGKEVRATLDEIEKAWNKVYPGTKASYAFLDETLARLYETEQRTSKLANTATGIAIFISCLGLFGLASFTAVQRTKEIGIRKVLGATVNGIVILLSREFLVLVGIAFVIAAPLAYFVANQWLSGFVYRTSLNTWIFIFTAVLSVLIAFLTVGYQAFKAGIANPINSLRYE